MESACLQPHICAHRLAPITRHTKRNTYECEDLGECKYGTDFNELFKKRPTEMEIHDLQEWLHIKGNLAQQEAQKRRARLFAKHNEEGQLISIMLDQKYKQIPELMGDILNELKSYKMITENDGIASVEIEGEGGWNPHIHVAIKKTKAPSLVAQPLYLKFVKDKHGNKREKYQCYRISVDPMPYGAAAKYVYGEKSDPEKLEKCKKDEAWRIENGMKAVYHINNI